MNFNSDFLYYNALQSRFEANNSNYEIINKIHGYEGERIVDNHLKLHGDIVYKHNLEFIATNPFQIDFLIVHNNQISILEVKHYYGDFEFFDQYIQSAHHNRYPSPFIQLESKNKSPTNPSRNRY